MRAPCIAVLGTGSAGTRHLETLRAAGTRVLALPLRASRRRELESAGFETASGLDEAAEAGAKACVIATDTGRHAQDALAALELGMDLLVEKPLAARAEQARAVLAAAQARGRRGWVACVLRFSPSLARFRERLPGLGALHAVRVECRSYLPDWRPGRPYRETYSARAEEGGVLRDLIHEIDYAGWIFGWPKAVYGRLSNTGRLGIAAEERADLLWDVEEGPSVALGLDYLTRTTRRGILACGERGELEWDGAAGAAQERSERCGAQAAAFAAALSGSASADPRLATLEDGFRALAVCDAARASSASGRREAVAAL